MKARKHRNYIVINTQIPEKVVEKIDQLIDKGYYQNRSDFIREAVRLLLERYGDILDYP